MKKGQGNTPKENSYQDYKRELLMMRNKHSKSGKSGYYYNKNSADYYNRPGKDI